MNTKAIVYRALPATYVEDEIHQILIGTIRMEQFVLSPPILHVGVWYTLLLW